MSNGLTRKKVDLHVHTPASKCFLDKKIPPEAIVQVAVEKKLDAIAITDHNTGAWIDAVKNAAKGSKLIIFPGVEISVSEGIHVVALFNVNKGSADITALLGALGIAPAEQGETQTLCKKGVQEVIEKIIEWDGLAVLAHVDQPKGAFVEMGGISLISLINEAPYHAIETSTGGLPADLTKERGFKRIPTCYQSSDNPDPNEPTKHSLEGLGAKYSYFKLERQIDLEGLRQCFADPEVRIRKMGSLEGTSFPKILSLRVSEGFLKHQEIRFHYGLNSIIGGKGVGKSLIIEFLRFALDQPSSDEDILNDYNGKLSKRLGPYNFVEITCQLPSGSEYKIKRILDGEHECVDVKTEQRYNGQISELFPILAYSQTEVIKIAEDEGAQLKLIDSFLDPRPHLARIETLNDQLSANDLSFAEAVRAKADLESYKRDLATVDTQIAEIDKSLKDQAEDTLLTEFRKYEAKKGVFEGFQGYLKRILAMVNDVRDQIEIDSPPSLEPSQLVDVDLTWGSTQCSDTHKMILDSLTSLKIKIEESISEIDKRIGNWLPTFESKKSEYLRSLEKEQTKQVLEQRRQALLEQRQELQDKVSSLLAQSGKLTDLQTHRDKLLDALDEAHKIYFDERKNIFDILSERSKGKLKLELSHATNRQKFQDRLKELVQGSNTRTSDIQTIAQNVTPREFVTLAQARDVNGLATRAEISVSTAQRIIDKLWSAETIQELVELAHSYYPEDVPSIQFRKDDGTYAPLNELSVGQKCTALLIIALSEGTRPVVIDQPEDSLDITTVWEDVSKKLRLSKEKRQFILTTHNPSVAVAADSDMFIVVTSTAQQANVKCLGAIEIPDVKKAVIQHLEGGPVPYHLRRDKYNM